MFFIKGHFQSFPDVEQFIDALQPYAHTKTNFIFQIYVRTYKGRR